MSRQNYSTYGRGKGQSYGRNQANYRSLIEVGARGFFFTVDGTLKESAAVREVYNLFNAAYDASSSKEEVPTEPEEEKADASDELSAACEEASSQSASNTQFSSNRPLRQIPTNVKNCLFFQTNLLVEDIYSIADRIVDRCQVNNCCRFVARVLPVELTTTPELNQFSKDFAKLLHYHFVETWKGDQSPTYALDFKARNNDQLKQKEVLMILDDHIRGLAPLAKVNLKTPDLSILVNVLHKNVLLSCVRNYHEKRKFSTRPPTVKEKASASDIAKEPTNEETVVS